MRLSRGKQKIQIPSGFFPVFDHNLTFWQSIRIPFDRESSRMITRFSIFNLLGAKTGEKFENQTKFPKNSGGRSDREADHGVCEQTEAGAARLSGKRRSRKAGGGERDCQPEGPLSHHHRHTGARAVAVESG